MTLPPTTPRERRPRVSLGLPVYNGADFLESCLDSLLSQTYEDFELVISDNGSTDRTEEICRDHAARDGRIRYSRSDHNRGGSWNFSRVFELSSGEYFKWSAHDDVLAPTHLERCVEVLEGAGPSVVLVFPRTTLIDEEGAFVRHYDDKLDLREPAPHERVRHLIRDIIMSNTAFGLIRSSALRQTRLIAPFVSSDYVTLFELALLGQFWEIPEHLFFRRQHAGMSRWANIGPTEVMKWFDPSHSGDYVTEFWRLFWEHLVSIERSPLTPYEKSRVYATFVRTWWRRHWRHMTRESKGVLRGVSAAQAMKVRQALGERA